MDARNLHRNPENRTACLCVKQEERIRFPAGSTLSSFMDKLVTPYLYGLSYYDRYGRWPWAEFSHGIIGMLEYAAVVDVITERFLAELVQQLQKDRGNPEVAKQLRTLSPNRHCPCGSLRAFRRCHAEAWNGVRRIHRDARALGVDLKVLMPRPA